MKQHHRRILARFLGAGAALNVAALVLTIPFTLCVLAAGPAGSGGCVGIPAILGAPWNVVLWTASAMYWPLGGIAYAIRQIERWDAEQAERERAMWARHRQQLEAAVQASRL